MFEYDNVCLETTFYSLVEKIVESLNQPVLDDLVSLAKDLMPREPDDEASEAAPRPKKNVLVHEGVEFRPSSERLLKFFETSPMMFPKYHNLVKVAFNKDFIQQDGDDEMAKLVFKIHSERLEKRRQREPRRRPKETAKALA